LKINNFIAEILKINNLTPDELPESKEFNRNFGRGGVKIYSEWFFSLTETKFKLLILVTDRIL
jgi:hypothetical protein